MAPTKKNGKRRGSKRGKRPSSRYKSKNGPGRINYESLEDETTQALARKLGRRALLNFRPAILARWESGQALKRSLEELLRTKFDRLKDASRNYNSMLDAEIKVKARMSLSPAEVKLVKSYSQGVDFGRALDEAARIRAQAYLSYQRTLEELEQVKIRMVLEWEEELRKIQRDRSRESVAREAQLRRIPGGRRWSMPERLLNAQSEGALSTRRFSLDPRRTSWGTMDRESGPWRY